MTPPPPRNLFLIGVSCIIASVPLSILALILTPLMLINPLVTR